MRIAAPALASDGRADPSREQNDASRIINFTEESPTPTMAAVPIGAQAMTPHPSVAMLASTVAQPLPLEVRGVDAACAEQLARLLDRLGTSRIALRTAEGRGPGLVVSADGATAAVRGQRRWAVRGLRGVVRAMNPELDVVIAAPATQHSRIDALAPALQLAANRDSARLHIVAEASDHGIARALRAEARRHGVEQITRGDLAATVAAVVERPADFDVVLVTGTGGRVLASVAAALAGTRALTPRLVARGTTVTAASQSRSVSALVLATARVLEGLGFRDAPHALENAWLCALEEGLEPAGITHVAPYTHRMDDATFLAALAERIGRTPKSLGAAVDRQAERVQPRLRLV